MNYEELIELGQQLKGQPFEVVAFPCNQFAQQENGTPEQIRAFVSGKLEGLGANWTVMEKVHVNGCYAHPVWHFLRYNNAAMRRRGGVLPVPWNFTKFLVDKQGRVFKHYSPAVKPSAMLEDIRGLIDGRLEGAPTQPPTIAPEAAPGFMSPSFTKTRTGTTLVDYTKPKPSQSRG